MGDGQTSNAAFRLRPQHAKTLKLLIDVEERRRLIQQQQARSLGKTRGKQHTLSLTAAQGPDRAISKREAIAPLHGGASDRDVISRIEPTIRRLTVPAHQNQRCGCKCAIGADILRKMREHARPLERR